MQGLACDCFHAAVGQPELIGKVSVFASWAHYPASCKLCGPTRQSRAAVHCVLDGPMRAKCPNIIVHVATHCVFNGPMRANCPNITAHETDPCECLRVIAFTLPWANPS